MKGTNVSNAALGRLSSDWEALSPEAQKAARYVIDNPHVVSISTVRELAKAAEVSAATVMRMARQAGYEGYEEFRALFRDAVRSGAEGFPDRARWLQDVRARGGLGALYADMAAATLRNIEETFAAASEVEMSAAAEAIWAARRVFTLGVGVHHANARNFTYLASTGMMRFRAIPEAGSNAVDDLATAEAGDLLIAVTCDPYRTEVVEAVGLARDQGLTVVALSDSRASPIARVADHAFVASVETPQYFPSSAPVIALLETLLSFVIAAGSPEIVERVERFHARRHALGLYHGDGG